MKALVLAAGKGVRLSPLTETRPKALLPIVGRPLMSYLVKDLAEAGVGELVVVVGHGADAIKNHFGDGTALGVQITYVNQKKLSGEAEAILCAEGELSREDRFLMADCDVVADSGLVTNTMRVAAEKSAEAVVALTNVANPSQFGVVRMDDEGRILDIVEKPPAGKAPSNFAISSLYAFTPNIFDALRRTRHLEKALSKMAKSGTEVYGAPWNGKWVDVGRPWDVLSANRLVVEKIFAAQQDRAVCESPIPQSARVVPPAYVGPRVRIMENAVIREAYIDEGATVGNNALVRDFSYVGKNVVVGFSSEVKNSVLMSRTAVGHLAYVGDSVFGQACEVGAGTATANTRFDGGTIKMAVAGELIDTGLRRLGAVVGDGAQLGIHVSVYPGRKIGSGAWIAPGAVISLDLPSNVFVRVVQRFEIIAKRPDGEADARGRRRRIMRAKS